MKFKDPTLQACYVAARAQAADNFSEFYYAKTLMGPRWPRRGAGHRDAYWNGRAGQNPRKRYPLGSPAYAFCAAGRDDAREFGAVTWNPMNLAASVQPRKAA